MSLAPCQAKLPGISQPVVGFPICEESTQLRLLNNVLQKSCLDRALHPLVARQEKLLHCRGKLRKHFVCVAPSGNIIETYFKFMRRLVTVWCIVALRIIANATQQVLKMGVHLTRTRSATPSRGEAELK